MINRLLCLSVGVLGIIMPFVLLTWANWSSLSLKRGRRREL